MEVLHQQTARLCRRLEMLRTLSSSSSSSRRLMHGRSLKESCSGRFCLCLLIWKRVTTWQKIVGQPTFSWIKDCPSNFPLVADLYAEFTVCVSFHVHFARIRPLLKTSCLFLCRLQNTEVKQMVRSGSQFTYTPDEKALYVFPDSWVFSGHLTVCLDVSHIQESFISKPPQQPVVHTFFLLKTHSWTVWLISKYFQATTTAAVADTAAREGEL